MMLPLLESISASLLSQISTSPLYKRLFRETVLWYLNIYLNPKPVRPSKRIRSRALCSKVINMLQESNMMATWQDECSDCRNLNEFLVSHDRRTLTLKVDMDVKDHLHSAFVLGKPDCELKMIPGDDGCQFIVTKCTKRYNEQYSAWFWGRLDVKGRIRRIGEPVLRTVLGQDFEDFWKTWMLRPILINGGTSGPSRSKRTASAMGALDRTASDKRPRH
jgi:hypothetical protein